MAAYFDPVDPCICTLLPGRECLDDADPVRCDDCGSPCLEPSGTENNFCCNCTWKHAPRSFQWEACRLCEERGKR